MREIKFRAWDNLNKEYWDYSKKRNGLDDGYLVLEESDLLFAEIGGLRAVSGNRFVLEQYTGLKDKNGVEIYEGDIRGGSFLCLDEEMHFKQVLKYSTKDMCFYWHHLQGGCKPEWMETEIVGNIHQNKELL